MAWSTEVSFDPLRSGEEAGTVVWLSTSIYAAIGVRGDGKGGLCIVFRRPDESLTIQVSPSFPNERMTLTMQETVGSETIPAGEPVTLFITAAMHQYDFAYQVKGDKHWLGSVPSSAFVPLFTGVHIGLYAQGANETPCRRSAFFRYARWDA